MPAPHLEPIAFIGLGQMGRPMARRLIEAGYPVRCYDLASDARDMLHAFGGIAAGSAREACAGASIVITMLPNGKGCP
jgi:3-hydroxyisobutyrate dehydrogenase-like beta-hydroxyacid dehydrogenase